MGAGTSFTFAFHGTQKSAKKVGEIVIALPPGSGVNASAFRRTCTLEGTGPKSGEVCGSKFRDARVGEGTMTVEMLGMHTVTADAYLVDGAPDGANLLFFFGAGQVFGVGAQSILGTISLAEAEPVRVRIADIQGQLDLPFGATAELEKGSFTFTGESGKHGFRNPAEGSISDWMFEIGLSWSGGKQSQKVRATALK